MAFSSLSFLFLFLPVFVSISLFVKNKAYYCLLCFLSLVFLLWAGPSLAAILLVLVLINWIFGKWIGFQRAKNRGNHLMVLIIIVNLLPLIVFKYFGFISQNINHLLIPMGFKPVLSPAWLLPLGISFYTFRLLSYQIDLYRSKIPVQNNILRLFLYASFFPQLGAGPIVRYREFFIHSQSSNVSSAIISKGLQRFILGLAKKVLIANNLGTVADAVFNLPNTEMTLSTSWLGIISYSLQVYYDFSGYSDMAIGLSTLAGFRTPENFNFPYLSKSIKDFWRRWHMTLTSWFRDYLFLPTAYSISKKMPHSRYIGIKTEHLIYIASIIITWFLVGLWHGSSWTFILWGVTFGVFLIFEQLGLGRLLKKSHRALQHTYALVIVMIAWVFFRASGFSQSITMIKGMTGLNGWNSQSFEYYRYFTASFVVVVVIAVAGAAGWLNQLRIIIWKFVLSKKTRNRKIWKTAYHSLTLIILFIFFITSVAEILRSGYSPFIYFKF